MVSYEWAPILRSRTSNIDFRFIAVPEKFRASDEEWALEHILVSTRSAEQLKKCRRWLLFKNNQYCVFGVTCEVRELIGENPVTPDISLVGTTPNYLFAGYVTEIRPDLGPIVFPPYTDLDPPKPDLFSDHRRFLEEQWFLKQGQERTIRTQFKIKREFQNNQLSLRAPIGEDFMLNYKGDQENDLFLWPDNQENRENLWAAAHNAMSSSDMDFFLCLGLYRKDDARQGPCLNATSLDVSEKERAKKIMEGGSESITVSLDREERMEPRQTSQGEGTEPSLQATELPTSWSKATHDHDSKHLLSSLWTISMLTIMGGAIGAWVGGIKGTILGAVSGVGIGYWIGSEFADFQKLKKDDNFNNNRSPMHVSSSRQESANDLTAHYGYQKRAKTPNSDNSDWS